MIPEDGQAIACMTFEQATKNTRLANPLIVCYSIVAESTIEVETLRNPISIWARIVIVLRSFLMVFLDLEIRVSDHIFRAQTKPPAKLLLAFLS